jgi:hypothetical protein
MEVLEVADEILHNGKTYSQATMVVTARRQLHSEHTIPNACTRLIGLNTRQFKDLLRDPPRLAEHLISVYPANERTIRKRIER